MSRPRQETRQSRDRAPTYRENAAKPDEAPAPGTGSRGSWDRARVPDGYHPAYWHLALLFQDLAMADGISLRAGVPVVYAEMRRAFAWFGLEGGTRAYQERGDGTVELTFAQVYRDGAGRPLTWQQAGEAIVQEFWTRQWDSGALECFCDPGVLTEVARAVFGRWHGQRITAELRSRAAHPAARTWNRDGQRRRARARR